MKTTILYMFVFATGCASQVMSPPARYMPHEGPSRAMPGETWVHLEGGGGGQVFGPSAGGGTVRLAHGADDLEWSGEASAVYVVDDYPSLANRLWGALRGGVRGLISSDYEHAFWGAGFGGGAYAGGVFLSPDVTFGIGYKNPYVIPYVSVSGIASLPLVVETVDTTEEIDEPTFDRPSVTFGYRVQAGLEVPIQDYAAFSVAFHGVGLMDLDGSSEGWVGFGGGFKLRL